MKLPESINYYIYNSNYTYFELFILCLSLYTFYIILFNILFLVLNYKKYGIRRKDDDSCFCSFGLMIILLMILIILYFINHTYTDDINRYITNNSINRSLNIIDRKEINNKVLLIYDIGYLYDYYDIISKNLKLYITYIYLNYNEFYLSLTFYFIIINILCTLIFYIIHF